MRYIVLFKAQVIFGLLLNVLVIVERNEQMTFCVGQLLVSWLENCFKCFSKPQKSNFRLNSPFIFVQFYIDYIYI